MIETGKILQQRYRIDKQIGQGGMGAVYIATDERFGSTVAIKETLCMDDNYRKAIEREARLLNSLKHTALPRVSDHFLEENGQFLVMEYISGEDLSFILEDQGEPFPVETVLNWADQLLDALDFLHNQVNPVIHRDIKPQNLKVTPRGQIILLDFGLAKGNPTDAGHHTAAKSIFGYSRNYASLEQIQGTGTDPRSDLYSLSATLYHLLTGIAPEDALTRAMAVLSQQPDPLIPANFVDSRIPAGVAGILYKVMDLNAAERPASAAEMRAMLREHENYSELAGATYTSLPKVETGIFTQKTRLMPGTTRHGIDRPTDVKTEVLPSHLSQVTALKAETSRKTGDGSVATPARGRPKFKMAAAAFGALFLACTAAAGVYLYEPSLFGDPTVPESEKIADVPAVEHPAADSPVAPVSPGAESASAADVDKSAEIESKKAEAVKSVRAESDRKKVDQVVIDGSNVNVGDLKITEGRVETPRTIIDENGIRQKVPNAVPDPDLPPNLRHLTPAQRRRLRMIRRNNVRPPRAKRH